MNKNRFIRVLVFLFTFALLSSTMVVPTKALAPKKGDAINHSVTQGSAEEKALAAINALYIDNTYNELKADTTQDDIFKASLLVDALPDGDVKDSLSILIFRAQYKFNHREATKVVYALYRDSEHTMIRDDLTQAEIASAHTRVETLPAGAIKVKLRVLVIIAQAQLSSREAVYALFTDDTHTALNPDINQTSIDNVKRMVNNDLIDEWPIKKELNTLLLRAQLLFNQREAQRVVDKLYSDTNHTTIRDDLSQADINHARAVVDALPAGPIKVKLRVLIIIAQKQFNERNPEVRSQISIDEKMVYDLFTDRTFTKLAPGVSKETIESVRSIVKLLYPTELNQYLMKLLDKADSLLP